MYDDDSQLARERRRKICKFSMMSGRVICVMLLFFLSICRRCFKVGGKFGLMTFFFKLTKAYIESLQSVGRVEAFNLSSIICHTFL